MASPSKKRKTTLPSNNVDIFVDDHEIIVHIVPKRIQKRRIEIMVNNMAKIGMKVSPQFGPEVTHVVTEFETYEQLLRVMCWKMEDLEGKDVVSCAWLTDCSRAGRFLPITQDYRIKKGTCPSTASQVEEKRETMPAYVCQRNTPLKHHNLKFTRALEIVEKHAEFRNDQGDYARARAFRQAACALKAMDRPVKIMQDLEDLPDVGNHCKNIVQEILEDGFCSEIDKLQDEWFKTMQIFTGLYGVGPSTAKKWIREGYTTVQDVIKAGTVNPKEDSRLCYGLAFHEDLNTPVSRSEASFIEATVTREVEELLPGATVELAGGFRRGKDCGHDVDLLISHPEEGKEAGVLEKLISRLAEKRLILQGRLEGNTFNQHALTKDNKSMISQLDHFEKWMGIMMIERNLAHKSKSGGFGSESEGLFSGACAVGSSDDGMQRDLQSLSLLADSQRSWVARRVDLIIVPRSQYYYALVGWIGSKHFNRDLRLYAQRELNLKLTSHGLFDMTTKNSIPAKSEKEVFENLNLQYRDPSLRNA